MQRRLSLRTAGALCAVLLAAGCASLPPGSDYPKLPSAARHAPAASKLGHAFESAARAHPGQSGFRILSVGVDGFLARAQLIDAQRVDETCFVWDSTGRLVAQGTQLAGVRLG